MPDDIIPEPDYERDSTQEIEIPTEEILTERSANRMALCLLACRGLDPATLEILAQRPEGGDGQTVLQHVLGRVSWTGLPTKR